LQCEPDYDIGYENGAWHYLKVVLQEGHTETVDQNKKSKQKHWGFADKKENTLPSHGLDLNGLRLGY
jgi:hypothetical protein